MHLKWSDGSIDFSPCAGYQGDVTISNKSKNIKEDSTYLQCDPIPNTIITESNLHFKLFLASLSLAILS